jgi:hypothetical protein
MRALAVIGLLLALGCRHQGAAHSPATVAHHPAETEGECRACNGEWGVHGLLDKPSCLCRTHDVGKVCKDGGDCEGECVVDDMKPEVAVTDPGPPARGYFLGRCSAFDHFFGCRARLPAGAKAHGPVRLDQELAEHVCVD